MLRHGLAITLLVIALCITFRSSAAGQAPEKIYRQVTSEKLEAVLKDLDITFQKNPGKKEGIFSYDFERKDMKVRLFNYAGEDLWIESTFNDKTTLDDVNRWNQRAKFSRAVLVKNGTNESISLESQVDCTLGMTDGMIRQFVARFDVEIVAFAKFLKK